MVNINAIGEKLARAQAAHPRQFLVVSALITLTAGIVATGLEFDASYEALLPEDAAEVRNADAVREQTGGTRQIVVAISGKDPESRLSFGRKLAEKIRGLKHIRQVDLEFPVKFFKDRGLWLMKPATLDKLIPAVEDAVRISKWQANPMHLHLDEEAEQKELDAAWNKVNRIVKKERGDLPFEEVLTSEDGRYTFMLVIPGIKFSNLAAGQALLEQIHQAVRDLDPTASGVAVQTAGPLDMLQEQNRTMVNDLRNASILAFIAGIFIVAVFTRRAGAPFLIGAALLCGIVWTFALTRLLIGHVNIITGFLVAVLVGLGIDFGVHLFVRCQQEWRSCGGDTREAILRATRGTLPPALTSALTTAGTFFSFTVADFRGFSEFGLIAGIGVLFTLASSFLILPPLLIILSGAKRSPIAAREQTSVKGPPARIGTRAAVFTVVAIGIAALYGARHVNDIPFRNNFRLLRGESKATEFLDYVDQNLGIGFNPAVLIVPNEKDAAKALKIAREQQSAGLNGTASRIGKGLCTADLLPKRIAKNAPRIAKLKAIVEDPKLDEAKKEGGKRARQLARARRMVKTVPWRTKDLPETFRRRMTTLDGKQSLAFIWPDQRNDADYQAAAWENELQSLSAKLDKAGITHSMADETLIVAWIYRVILADGLPLLMLAGLVVLIFLALDFRSLKDTMLVAFPLAVGMLVFVCLIYGLGLELNMFNMIVLPSVIGIGIDNAVHIYHRYREEGRGSIVHVLRTTGKAALLASLTTGIGFASSLVSHNVGLKTLGLLAVIGIFATLVASTVFFPCLLTLLEGKKGLSR